MPTTILRSPWTEQIASTRAAQKLTGNRLFDVAVVGAGISGIATTHFLLSKTNKDVLLIEAGRVAHGATGHNAGQMTSYFERPFFDIVSEFGLDLAADGQRAVESAWDHIEDIRREYGLQTPYAIFEGYVGFANASELLTHFKNAALREKAGLHVAKIFVVKSWKGAVKIPSKYKKYYELVPQKHVLQLLESKDRRYIAALGEKKGVMNSALFCEELITALVQRYPERLKVVEHTPVNTVRLFADHAELVTPDNVALTKRVILCTNGFERITIENTVGANIDTKFHHLVRGSVGYMAAFTEEPFASPTAISYLPPKSRSAGAFDADPYFYLTRRFHADRAQGNLVCIGGPEALMDDTNGYTAEHPYPEEARQSIDAFMRKTYSHAGRKLKYGYFWHGLMGYTPNGIRCVGAEPCNPVLMYNLGCNGVGILPSIYGGFRIAQLVAGEAVAPSIFDPADQRCMIPEKKPLITYVFLSRDWFAAHAAVAFILFWSAMIAVVFGLSWLRNASVIFSA